MKWNPSPLVPEALVHQAADLLALPVFEDEGGAPLLAVVDKALSGLVERAMADEEIKAKRGQVLLVHTHGKVAAPRLLVVGMGKRAEAGEEALRRYAGTVARCADRIRAKDVAVVVPEGKVEPSAALAAVAEGLELGLYRFNRYLTRERGERVTASATLLHTPQPSGPAPVEVVERTDAMCTAVALARDLVNEPASTLNPVELANRARQAAQAAGLGYQEMGPSQLAAERMELFLAVSRASVVEPRLCRIEYVPTGPARKKVVLVGKGLTFDAGGLDLKTAEGMADMKVDMSGAAAVLGTMTALATFRPDVHVVGYLACTENMVGGRAYKPGDVLKSRRGLTVEITNTDAEGRLVLADALSYAQDRDAPDEVVDVATLTGACMIALGPYTAGLFSPDAGLADALAKAGEEVGEDFWRMPLPDGLKEMLKSPVADLRNTGTQRYGGAITAALFLKEFIKDGITWAHLDIAGPATIDKERDYLAKGGTGFGVRTLVRYLVGC